MKRIEELTNQVYEKVNNELKMFKEELKTKGIDEVIKNAFKITIREEIVDMFYGTSNYSEYGLKALLELDNTLESLYDDWIDTDVSIHNFLEDTTADYISDLEEEYIEKIEEQIKEDPNYELIQTVYNALKDFDNYSFCINIKNKYDIEEFDLININDILYSKDGARYLYGVFDYFKDNEQLQYLNEIMAINSENYSNIEEKILPSLVKIIKEQEKNKIKTDNDMER